MSPVFPNSIEVFDLAENQDMLSPVELDPEKLAHKFKEVSNVDLDYLDPEFNLFFSFLMLSFFLFSVHSSRLNML